MLVGASTVVGGLGADQFGGDLRTTISFESRTGPQHIDLSTPGKINAEGDSVIGSVAGVIGGSGNDTIIGSTAAEILQGGDGNDSLLGADGNDALFGGDGDDTLMGGAGKDDLDGGLGSDLMDGGSGRDWVFYSNRTENLTITLDGIRNDGAAGENDQLLSIENVYGGEGANYIVGNYADNLITCQAGLNIGHNTLFGGGGNDTLQAGPSGDSLHGGNGNDSLVGGPGNDDLWGDAGNDTMLGGIGSPTSGDGDNDFHAQDGEADTIIGGRGNDKASVDPIDSVTHVETIIT